MHSRPLVAQQDFESATREPARDAKASDNQQNTLTGPHPGAESSPPTQQHKRAPELRTPPGLALRVASANASARPPGGCDRLCQGVRYFATAPSSVETSARGYAAGCARCGSGAGGPRPNPSGRSAGQNAKVSSGYRISYVRCAAAACAIVPTLRSSARESWRCYRRLVRCYRRRPHHALVCPRGRSRPSGGPIAR